MRIQVKLKDGRTGTIEEKDFDAAYMSKVFAENTTQQTQSTMQPAEPTETKYITGRSLEEHQQALQAARSAGDTTSAKQIQTDYDTELDYQKEFGTVKQTGEEKEKVGKYKAIENFVNTLEERYEKGGAGNTNLGALTRLLGIKSSLGAKSGFNAELERYEAEKKGFVATIKELSGDTGVLTEQDAKRLLGLLPGAGATKKEAEIAFGDIRSQIAAKYQQKAGKSTFNPEEKDILDLVLPGARNVAQDIGAGGASIITSDARKKANDKAFATANKLADLAEKSDDPKEKKMLLKEANQLLAQVSKGEGEVSKSFSKDVEKNPIMRGAGAALEIGTLASLPGAAKAVRKAPGTVRALIKGEGGAAAVLRPAVAGKALRNEVVEAADKAGKVIEKSKIANSMQTWADDAVKANPGEEKAIKTIVDSVKKSFNKGTLRPSEAFKLYDDVDSGFTQTGITRTPIRAEADRALRSTLRKLIEEQAPGFDKGTKQIAEGLKRGKFVRKHGGKIGAGVISTAAIALLLKSLNKSTGGEGYQ